MRKGAVPSFLLAVLIALIVLLFLILVLGALKGFNDPYLRCVMHFFFGNTSCPGVN